MNPATEGTGADMACQPPVFVLGKGRNALAAVRSLGRRGVSVTLVNSDPQDPARASRFCAARASPDPAESPEAFVDFLCGLAPRQGPRPVLIPTGDLEVTAVSEGRERLAGLFALSMAERSLIRSLVRKDAFADLAARHELPVPRTWVVRDPGGLEAVLPEVEFPCVLKPAYSPAWRRIRFGTPLPPDQHGRMKRLEIRSPVELRAAYAQAAKADPAVVIQERVEGGDDALHDVYAFIDALGALRATYVIRKRRTWPADGNGGGSCVESAWNTALERTAVGFLKAVGYRGSAAVCFKRSERDGRFYVIEVNARLALHHALASREAVDFTWLTYLDAIGRQVPTLVRRPTGARWVALPDDFHAFRAYQARRALGVRRWVTSLRGPRVGAHYASDDRRPGLAYATRAFPTLARVHAAAARVSDGLGDIVGRSLWTCGIVAWLRRRPARRAAGPMILRYHSVGGHGWLRSPLVTSPAHFDAHVRYVSRCYRVVPIEAIVKALHGGPPAPPGAVAITLDDGYRDNYHTAWPILRGQGCPATIFVIVEPLETGIVPWPQRLFGWLHKAGRASFECALSGPYDGSAVVRRFDLSSPSAREAAYKALKAVVGALGREAREVALTRVAHALGLDPAESPAEWEGMLRWEEVRELAAEGLTIGSHTMTHASLAALGPEQVAWELETSRRVLETRLGRPVTLLAYPFGKPGHVSAATAAAAHAAGYGAAVTTIQGVDRCSADPFQLRRIQVLDDPLWRFAFRLLEAQAPSRLARWVLGPSHIPADGDGV
jgi:predicted ATP-grasp superfamily ATP-dependent carboligase/peptidoglycan/xylan/chitin deacetylase (PgdA/CDA1 family)